MNISFEKQFETRTIKMSHSVVSFANEPSVIVSNHLYLVDYSHVINFASGDHFDSAGHVSSTITVVIKRLRGWYHSIPCTGEQKHIEYKGRKSTQNA